MRKIVNCNYWLIMILFIVTSCINDEKHDCCNYISVEFTYHRYTDDMESVDAFCSTVNQITLYVFDEEGQFIEQQSVEGEALLSTKFKMNVSNVDNENLQLVVWGGINKGSFEPTTLTVGTSSVCDLLVAMSELHSSVSDKELTNLFYGSYKLNNYSKSNKASITIPLIKNTNVFRILLISYDEEKLNADNYAFYIVDKNSAFDASNELASELEVTYRSYIQGDIVTREMSEIDEYFNSVLYAELSTAKLFANHSTCARLRIYNHETKTTILDLPLIKLILLMKQEKFGNSMTNQTYLDRIHSYHFTFFTQNNLWINSSIRINDWALNLKEVEF